VRVSLKESDLNALGENFEQTQKGFVDFLLLNEKGFPFVVLEAKSEDKNPLFAKEQARKYARSQNCRFVILSNGNLQYFGIWRGATRAVSGSRRFKECAGRSAQ
jgi:type I restriction enzyme R subunit